jgi:hypothetical protein
MFKISWLFLLVGVLSSCANYNYPSQVKLGQSMLQAKGESLEGQAKVLPDDFLGQNTLLLLGYKQDSQFDIDRWLIGLDMTKTKVAA